MSTTSSPSEDGTTTPIHEFLQRVETNYGPDIRQRCEVSLQGKPHPGDDALRRILWEHLQANLPTPEQRVVDIGTAMTTVFNSKFRVTFHRPKKATPHTGARAPSI